MSLNKAKWKILHLSHDNPCYQYKLRDKRIEHSPAIKDLEVQVDGMLDISHQCTLMAQNENCMLGCTRRRVASRSREVILSLYPALDRLHLEFYVKI